MLLPIEYAGELRLRAAAVVAYRCPAVQAFGGIVPIFPVGGVVEENISGENKISAGIVVSAVHLVSQKRQLCGVAYLVGG